MADHDGHGVSMHDVLATDLLCTQELCYFRPVQVDHLLPQETLKPHRLRCYNVSLCANFVLLSLDGQKNHQMGKFTP